MYVGAKIYLYFEDMYILQLARTGILVRTVEIQRNLNSHALFHGIHVVNSVPEELQ